MAGPQLDEYTKLHKLNLPQCAFNLRRVASSRGTDARTKHIEVVRRAYQLWQEAGEPSDRDQEFYLQAERDLQGLEDRGDPAKGSPDDI